MRTPGILVRRLVKLDAATRVDESQFELLLDPSKRGREGSGSRASRGLRFVVRGFLVQGLGLEKEYGSECSDLGVRRGAPPVEGFSVVPVNVVTDPVELINHGLNHSWVPTPV